MKPHALLTIAFALLPLAAQKPAELKKQLTDMETKAKSDVKALLEAGKWAKDKGLDADSKRILQKVVQLDPENSEAHAALGFVKHEGKWQLKEKVDTLIRQQEEASYAAKGMLKVDGVWVEKEQAANAKLGIFMHEGQLVSKEEKLALLAGKVRHPRTGELMDKADAATAEKQFKLSSGRWVDEKEADEFHSNPSRPWVVRTHFATVISTLPLQKIDTELKTLVDGTIESLKPLFGGRLPHPGHRPVIFVSGGSEAYRDIGTRIGAEGSSFGAFYADREVEVEGIAKALRPAVANWHDDSYGPYYVRHAAGLGYVHALLAELGAEAPLWFTRGVGSLAERFYVKEVAKFFGQQHVTKGGVNKLEEWFASFAINGDVEPAQIGFHVYQAGLLLSFARDGGDKQATEGLTQVTDSFLKNPKSIESSIQKLEKLMGKKENEVRAYLQKLVSG